MAPADIRHHERVLPGTATYLQFLHLRPKSIPFPQTVHVWDIQYFVENLWERDRKCSRPRWWRLTDRSARKKCTSWVQLNKIIVGVTVFWPTYWKSWITQLRPQGNADLYVWCIAWFFLNSVTSFWVLTIFFSFNWAIPYAFLNISLCKLLIFVNANV